MTTTPSGAKSVHRLPLLNRVFMAGVVSLAFFFPDAIGAYWLTHNEFMMFVLLAIVHVVIFLVFFKLCSRVSLAISPTGIEYRSPVHRIRTTWDNVEGIARVGGWTKPVQGLRLRKPVRPFPYFALLFAAPRRDIDRSIPLEIFARQQWQESKVGQDIRRHAPHLLGSESI
jgi:hypothetical protein